MAEPVVAEVETPESPETGDAAPVEQGEVSGLASALKGMTADEATAFLDNLDPEVKEAVVGEIERRGEQRARTRKQETEQADSGRTAAFDSLIAVGEQSEKQLAQYLQNLQGSGYLDENTVRTIATHAEAYKTGAMAFVGKQNDSHVQSLSSKYADDLKDITPAEQRKIDEAAWRDARQGTLSRVEVLMEIVLDRRERGAEERGVGKGKNAVKPELIEKVNGARKAISDIPPRAKSGTPSKGVPPKSVVDDMKAIDVTTPDGYAEFIRRQEEFRRSVKSA